MSDDLFSHLERLAAGGDAAVLATLVATEGARPRRPGAKLLVGADGTATGSVTLGGCVEARVADVAQGVLESGRARLLRVDLAAEEAFDLGLSCAATLELLIEPVLPLDRSEASLSSAAAWLRPEIGAGHDAALVVRLDGGTARLAVLDDGRTHGSLGSPALDRDAIESARAAIERRASTVELAQDDARLFIDVFSPPLRVLVFGAGPVTQPLVRFARELGMHAVVVDARTEHARTIESEGTGEVRVGSPGRIAEELDIGARDAVVVLSHDYKYELPVLETVLRGSAGYIGLLGSRRRGEEIRALLGDRGFSPEALARVRVPAGLDLGAEAPAEIALAILAEMMALRTGRSGGPLAP